MRSRRRIPRFVWGLFLVATGLASAATSAEPVAQDADGTPLAGTAKLDWPGDIASRLVDSVDRFLLKELDQSVARREHYWKRDFSSAEKYNASIEPNRQRLAHILGVRDPRVAGRQFELVQTVSECPMPDESRSSVLRIRWPAFGDVYGEGLLLFPTTEAPRRMCVVALPDADQTPEMLVGLAEGVPPESQFARRLAESGCVVVVPALINRAVTHRKLSNREYLYRSAFEMGRHLIGYEVQKVLAAVERLREFLGSEGRVGVMGWGEGGMLALYAAALEPQIHAVCVSGYFDSRQNVWQEPLYRNVFGLLEQFGDAELSSMIAPRPLIIEAARGPELVVPPGTGGGPGRLVTPKLDDGRREVARAKTLVKALAPSPRMELVVSGDGAGPYGSEKTLIAFLDALAPGAKLAPQGRPVKAREPNRDADARHARQMHELDRHTQGLLSESPYVRQEFMKKLDTSSLDKYEKSIEWYRDFFSNEVIGRFDEKPLPFNPRSRKAYDKPKWTGYEVVLDVFADVFAYGILLVPKDSTPGVRRPVVVCQHGLEGRPQDVVTADHRAYHEFAAKLAEEGFVTFAPQNLYIFQDRFRTLQRKANPIKKTLFSIIVPQHQQIVDWLGTLPFVDPKRIGFYGLSYGGKTAMRVPALVKNYCLSICSGDFDEWVWKNASTRTPYSYVWTGEYEIFEFDLGSTFNYAEMAALIAPRPFMGERGHFDGVAPDEAVAYEYAKVRFLYAAKLKIPDRTQIEWFVGPHTINGKGTFEFLRRHLHWNADR